MKKRILKLYENDVIRYIFWGGCTTLVNLLSFYIYFLSFPQHNPRLNSAQSWCFHYIRLYTKLILFSSLYYNFIYILKKKENTNEHITKHNLRLLKPLPIPKKNGRKNIEIQQRRTKGLRLLM